MVSQIQKKFACEQARYDRWILRQGGGTFDGRTDGHDVTLQTNRMETWSHFWRMSGIEKRHLITYKKKEKQSNLAPLDLYSTLI